jgi:hypothetical protein
MGGNSARTGILYQKTEITVFSYEKELLVAIEKWMEPFLALHNFGFRQSKGFGCFTLEKTTKQKSFEKFLHIRFPYFWRYSFESDENKELIYEFIEAEYIKLKRMSEDHERGKPKVFEYMLDKKPKITWEKTIIKRTLKQKHPDVFKGLLKKKRPNNQTKVNNETSEKPEFRYVRALLGLAEHNEYRMFKSSGLRKIQIKIDDKFKKIKRFQSPLQFKIFQNFIYILPHTIPNEMFGRTFVFKLKQFFFDRTKSYPSYLFDLPTPTANEFSMNDFLNHALGPSDWKRRPPNE